MFRWLKRLGRRRRAMRSERFHRFLRRPRLYVELLETRTLLSVYDPLEIGHAYGFDQIRSGGVVGDGSGQTIAIIDAYFNPTIQNDLAVFNQRFGLPALDGANGNGTFTQVDLSKGTLAPRWDDWTLESALDVEWAHAIAPRANIVLVSAASDALDPVTGEPADLLNAVQYAATKTGASVVSMSWGIPEVPGETNWDSFFTTPGVTFLAASGDNGAGTIWPAVSPNVVSVGGTTLRLGKSGAIASETGWGSSSYSWLYGGSGGGFSRYESLPSYQQVGITSSLTQFGVRLSPDVAYDANPVTGFSVYDGYAGGWFSVGGTSAGAPQWAALVAIANQARALNDQAPLSSMQTLTALYSSPGAFHDVTQGSTGAYTEVTSQGQVVGQAPVRAGQGYDLVTGLGSPQAPLVVAALNGTSQSSPVQIAPTQVTAAGAAAKPKAAKQQVVVVSTPQTPTVTFFLTGPNAPGVGPVLPGVAVTPAVAAPAAQPVVPAAALFLAPRSTSASGPSSFGGNGMVLEPPPGAAPVDLLDVAPAGTGQQAPRATPAAPTPKEQESTDWNLPASGQFADEDRTGFSTGQAEISVRGVGSLAATAGVLLFLAGAWNVTPEQFDSRKRKPLLRTPKRKA
jgi:hypothetical protein